MEVEPAVKRSGNILWPATFSRFLGGFQVEQEKAIPLAQPAWLTAANNEILLVARYDPRGSGWLALFATVLTWTACFVLAPAFGFFAGPGWPLWYLIFFFVRRRQVSIKLQRAESIVLDVKSQRMAFRLNFAKRKRWIAFQIDRDFGEAAESVRNITRDRCREGRVTRASVVPVLVLLLAIGVLVAFIIVQCFSGRH